MTKAERKVLGGYVRDTADAMELRDWTIELMHDPCEDGAMATVNSPFGRKLARVWVCEDFRERSAEEQRDTIVHELVHLHLESAASMVRTDLEEHLGKQADKLFFDAWRRLFEYGIDGLSAAIAKHLPLIDWGTK